mmetsp:Transcript_52409/g.147063  ORF Transcript_52409/g.147063 Transcript_52409/m.147063 type:complete len:315 (-) Transcript_52409:1047-1991(-)
MAERQQPRQLLHPEEPRRARHGDDLGQRCRIPGWPRGPHRHHGQQPRLPPHRPDGAPLREAVGGRRHLRGGANHGAGGGRGAHRGCQASSLLRRRRLRHGHDLRCPNRRHLVHVRGGHRGLLAHGADVPRLHRHHHVRAALQGAAELLWYRHQGLCLVRVEPAAAPLGLVGFARHDPHRRHLGPLQLDPHADLPQGRELEAGGHEVDVPMAAVREGGRGHLVRRGLRQRLRLGGADGQVRAPPSRRLRRARPLQLSQGVLQPRGVVVADHVGGGRQLALQPPRRGGDPPRERVAGALRLHLPQHRPHRRARAER